MPKKKANADASLASALGIALKEDNAIEENVQLKQQLAAAQANTVPTVTVISPSAALVDVKVHQDADTARDTLLAMIDKNNKSIDQLMEIARESMTPRAYEVVGNLIRHNADIAEKLLKIHADKQKVQNNAINLMHNEMQANTPGSGNTNIINIDKAVFTGTTSDLLTLVRDATPIQLQDQSAEDDDADPRVVATTNG